MRSLGDLLEIDADPHRVVVHHGDQVVTAGELGAAAQAHAAAAVERAVAPGDPVAVVLDDGHAPIAAWFGLWWHGATVVPINPRLTDAEQTRIVDAAGAVAVVSAQGWARTDEPGGEGDPGVALITTTSGTTGPPVPMPLRHADVLGLMDAVLGSLGVDPDQPRDPERPPPMPNLVPVPLSLWAGIYNVLFAFRVGAPVVLLAGGFEPAAFAAAVRRHQIRSTVLPPAAMVALTEAADELGDLAPLRLVRSITAPLDPTQARRFHDRFGVVVLNSYGQTELGGEVIGWSAADARAHGADKLGALGRPHDGVRVRIDDGEICVSTPATRAGRVPAVVADRLDRDGFLRTGDLGRVDEDGFVWIEGRVSDLIIRGGLKVVPDEVEAVLRTHPDVADAAVVGVPDDRLGEVPVAFVVLRPGASLDAAALEAHVRAALAAYKVPVRFEAVDALPRNDVGKVMRRALIGGGQAST